MKWRDEAPEGKLDLLMTIDFRQTSTTIFSDVVLPAATWYEKHDLNTTDMHPFVHSFNPAIAPPWQTRTDWDAWQTIAEKFSELAATHLGVRKDVVAVPLTHDTPDAMANPHGVVRDWKKGECEPIPGVTMPKLVEVERDYGAVAEKMNALGPLVDTLGATTKGVTFELSKQVDYLRAKNGAVRGGVADGRPSLKQDVNVCEAILAMSGTTNGHLATQGFKTLEKRTGVELADLAEEHEGKQITFADTQGPPVPVITSPEWSGSETGGRRYSPFTINVERKKPWHTLTGRMHFYLDHDWMTELGEGLPVYRPPLNMAALFAEPALGNVSDGSAGQVEGLTVRYLTPHNKWSIHSEYQDNLFMLSLSRGGQNIWMSDRDAAKVGIKDNDWIEAVNRNGVVVARAIVSHRMPEGTVYMYHAQDRLIDVPLAETSGKRGGIHNSLTRLLVKPTPPDRRLRPADLRVQLPRPHRQPARRGHHHPQAQPGRDVLMRVMAQMAMVMNLDKCIGCHTCSVTCKQAWTNRSGTEYIWFNNVETRPGLGYPRTYEDQEKWQGGWELNKRGRLKLKAGGRFKKLLTIFSNPKLPSIGEYYEPWTYDYATLTDAPAQEHTPVARPKSLISGKNMKIEWSANWDDDLGGSTATAHRDPMLKKIADKVKFEFEQTFMFYLPRICEHCLNPSCAASCPSGAIYKREEDGIVLVDQDRCRGWRHVRLGLPLQEDLLQPPHRQGREVHVLLPAHRGRPADRLLGDLRRPAALHRPDALRRRQGARGRLDHRRPGPLRGPARRLPRPVRPRGDPRGGEGRHRPRLDRRRPALPDLRPDQHLQGRAAAAPGVPHDADGLVHPAAVAGRRRRRARPARTPRTRATCSPRSTPCGSRSSTSPSCSRPATSRRWTRVLQEARRDALLHARHQHGPRPGRARSRPRSG